jgi:TorA maturation chaperone TorD
LQPELEITTAIVDEDRMRADVYALLGRLLATSPKEDTLKLVASLTGDSSELGQALSALAVTARGIDVRRIDDEYQALFIGVARGELLPYASYYLTGFLYSKPLATLRGDMARLGIARADGASNPEDHIASLCEMMAGLITGAFDRAVAVAEQRSFFDAHIAPWASRFFADLEASPTAAFYMPVGKVGRTFMDIETQAFALAA